jgi:subfamily B ATP-binding cassette protein MsbA
MNSFDLEYSGASVIRRLVHEYVKPYSSRVLCAVFFMVVVAACSATVVHLVKPAIDQIFITKDPNMLIFLPSIMAGVYCIKGVAEYYQNYLVKSTGQIILTDLQMQMYKHLLELDVGMIQSQSSGRLISRFTNDISLMRGAVSELLVGCAKHLLSVIFLICIMFRLEPILSSIVFIAFPIAIYPIQKLGKKIRKVSGKAQEELGNYTAKLDETFHAIKVVKSFQGEEVEAKRASKIASNILEFYKNTAKSDAMVAPIMEILSGCAIGGIVWYGGLLVLRGETTPGALFAFITAFVSAYRPFKSLVSLNVNLQEGIAAARRVFNILDTKPKIANAENAIDISFDGADIAFENVLLEFDGKSALNFINLNIQNGKTTAIVGRSGSGKTSIGNLLVRFYDPNEGKILLNGIDLNNIKIECLRSNIALVTQDTVLFDTTVAQNIGYGIEEEKINDHITKIIECAKIANADEFIQKLPDRYMTKIGTHGFSLSGGQRQRLSIARAFFKNSQVLIFDEATSALDSNSEKLVLNSLLQLRKSKTNIIITHRLCGIACADRIIVLLDGKLKEQGSHQELMAQKGEYYNLYIREEEELNHGQKF